MRTFLKFLLLLVAACSSAGAKTTPINNGVLQNALNANKQSVTNVANITDTSGNSILGRAQPANTTLTNLSGVLTNQMVFTNSPTLLNSTQLRPTNSNPFVFGGGSYLGNSWLSNTIASSKSTNLILPAATFDSGPCAIWVPKGFNLSGSGPENTTIYVYNISLDSRTNGGGFWLSDNCSIENLFINQTNREGWPVATIGGQRINQTSPIPTAANLAATSTNVVIRNCTINGAKTSGIILNCTNTFSWKILDSTVTGQLNQAISIGLAGTTGDGDNPVPVTNPKDFVDIENTSVGIVNAPATVAAGVKVNFSGIAILHLNNITNAGSGPEFGVRVAGTNATIYLNISGAQVAPAASPYYSLYLDGSSNTVYCQGGVFSYLDQGFGNHLIFTNQPFVYGTFSGDGAAVTNVNPSLGGIPALVSNTTLVSSNAISGNDRAFLLGFGLDAGAQQPNSNYMTVTLSHANSTNPVIVQMTPQNWGIWTNSGGGNTASTLNFIPVTTSNSITFQTAPGAPTPGSESAWAVHVDQP